MYAGSRRSPRPDWDCHFIALIWGRRSAPQLADRLKSGLAEQAHLRLALEDEGLLLFIDPARPDFRLRLVPGRSAALIGMLFDRNDSSPRGEKADIGFLAESEGELAAHLFSQCWGTYVAIARDPSSGCTSVARDPGGGLEVFLIDCGGAALVTNALPAWLVRLIDRPISIDQALLANALSMPIMASHRCLLRNVTAVPPGGQLLWDGARADVRQCWDPVRFVLEGSGSAADIREAVLRSTRTLGRQYENIVLELSGGLDSAIVLGALASDAPALDLRAVNLATRYAGGDERGPARDAADKWHIELAEVAAREEEIDYARHLSGPQPVQPILYGLDPILEHMSSGLADAFGGKAIFTGQGGDAVFFQMPTDRVALDFARERGLRALFSRVALDSARRARASIWSVQRRMLKDRLFGTAPETVPVVRTFIGATGLPLLDPSLARHPWLVRSHELPPGKQMQLLAVANCQLFNGPTLRRQRRPLVHPLMLQPVIEACLAVPTYALSYGTIDRALARDIFQDFLPVSTVRRRGKGEASSYYRRAIIENLEFLRAHLLEGRLVAHGLLDCDALDDLMAEEAVIWDDRARMITLMASFEAWARYWGL